MMVKGLRFVGFGSGNSRVFGVCSNGFRENLFGWVQGFRLPGLGFGMVFCKIKLGPQPP